MKRNEPAMKSFTAIAAAAFLASAATPALAMSGTTHQQHVDGPGAHSGLIGHWAEAERLCRQGGGLRLAADGTAWSDGLRGFWSLRDGTISLFLRPTGEIAYERRRDGYRTEWRVAGVDNQSLQVVVNGEERRFVRCA